MGRILATAGAAVAVGIFAFTMGGESSNHEAMSAAVVHEIDEWAADRPASDSAFETDTYSEFQDGIDTMWSAMDADTLLGLSIQQRAGSICVIAALNGADTKSGREAYNTGLQAQSAQKRDDREKADGWFRTAKNRCTDAVIALNKDEYTVFEDLKPVEEPEESTKAAK